MDIVGINPHPERSAIIAKSRFQPDRQKKQRHGRIGVAGIEPENSAAERVAHLVIELRELRDSLTPRRWAPSGMATLMWGLATAGAVTGGIAGSLLGTTPGRASFVGSAALWTGAITGLFVGAVTPESDEEYRDDNALFAAAIGLNVGAVAGMFAAGPISPSIARVRFIDLAGAAGALVSGGLYWAVANEDVEVQPLMGSLAAGMTVGVAAGTWLTSGMKPDRRESEGRRESPERALEYGFVPSRDGAKLEVSGSF